MSTPVITKKPSLALAIVKTWLLAGTVDGLAVMLWTCYYTHVFSIKLFAFVASGIFGNAAFTGGNMMIVWGILAHYFIAFCFVTAWFLLYPFFNSILRNKYIIAIVYGLITWAIMDLIVVPLSNTPKQPFNLTNAITGAVILMFTIGLTTTLMAHSYYYKLKGRLLYL
jgi:hypothetical protein